VFTSGVAGWKTVFRQRAAASDVSYPALSLAEAGLFDDDRIPETSKRVSFMSISTRIDHINTLPGISRYLGNVHIFENLACHNE
jgi:hypothetical protein